MSPRVSVGLEGPNLLAVCPLVSACTAAEPTLYELEPDDKRLILPRSGRLAELGMGFQAGTLNALFPSSSCQRCAEKSEVLVPRPLNVAHSYLWKLCDLV